MNSKLKHIDDLAELAPTVNWSSAELAKKCGISVRTLERYFEKEIGKSPKAWLSEQRQQRAMKLLREGCSVKETAGILNYKHPSHLTNEFKKHWGDTPTRSKLLTTV